MTPKSKKSQNSSLWYNCDSCHCFICHKDLQDHQANFCSNHDGTVSKEINAFNWKHVFVKSRTFYGFLEELKSPDVSNVVAKDVILLSQSAMQICEFVIGDPVIVHSKLGDGGCADANGCINCHYEVKTVWPTNEGAVSSVFCPKQGMEMSWGLKYGPIKITKIYSIPLPAAQVTFSFTKSVDVPEKIDSLINFLHHQMIGKIFHDSSRIAIDFYGKKMKLIFLKVEPCLNDEDSDGVLGKEIDQLSRDLSVKLTTDCKGGGGGASFNEGCDVQFYRIFENTKWILKEELIDENDKHVKNKKSTLDDVGGYNDILNDLKHLMMSGLKKNHPSSHYKGIKMVKGVLLYGLHGVGKTLIAHGLANSFGVHTVAVQSGDLFSKFYGEAESRLRSLFKEASMNAPSVMVLDDIDTICPKRGVSDQERRVVATLLSLLDSLEEGVIILATTSQLHTIDPALRRPGRLDREIELPVPSLTDREDILMRMLKQPGLVDNENIIRGIAAVAHGYVGADLGAVVSHAHARAAQFNGNIITADILEWALTQVKPSAMREVLVRVPDVKWSDIAGQDRLKLQLRQAVEWPLNHPEAFARLGITPPRGVLMFGPPGCSKTMIAKALATESKLNFISIKGPELFSKWVGESERAVRAVFKRARSVAPSIIFLDELDAIAGERGGDAGGSAGGGASVQERVLAQLLTELDGVEPLRNVVIVAATNRPDRIDKALLRPGRLDRLIYVPLPDLTTRRQILHLQFRKTPIASDIDVDDLAGLMDGYSGAEVVAVCHEAALCALEEDGSASEVKSHHFKYALNIVTPRTPGSLIALYEKYIAR